MPALLAPPALAASWEKFYCAHANKFFKTRSYLELCFPQLHTLADGDLVCEIGCGTGACLLPLLRARPTLRAHGVDVASAAIRSLEAELEKEPGLAVRCQAQVCDAQQGLPFEDETAAAILVVFTLSSLPRPAQVVLLKRAAAALRPGGYLFFRDYGLYDMVQMRCKRRVDDCTYIKEDGILCVFFSLADIEHLALQAGLLVEENKYCTVRNRNRKIKQDIDRVFLHAVLRKPKSTPATLTSDPALGQF
jgi:methyltransferase-like protein 6